MSLPEPLIATETRGTEQVLQVTNRDTEERKTRNWRPSESPLLQTVLTNLVELYRVGTLKEELRPQTLRALGGDYAALYHAAFHRLSRPAWAVERFPEGFSSLVVEINTRLTGEGIQIRDTKQDVGYYGKMKRDEVDIIKIYQSLYTRNELTRDDAIEALRNEHRIVMPESRQRYYFPPRDKSQSVTLGTPEGAIEQRKSDLFSRIEKIKQMLGIELGIKECVQGLTFEAFVGVYLAFHFGSENLVTQRRLGIPYVDLFGTPHKNVYLDFFVRDPEYPEIFEIKLRNSFETILNSALPQLLAFEEITGKPQSITVLYRHACPLLRFAVDAGITIDQELQQMGLEKLIVSGRRLDRMIRYLSVEELFEQDPSAGRFMQVLPDFDYLIERGDITLLRQYEDALKRIASNPEAIEEKLQRLAECASTLSPLPTHELNRLYGPRSTRTDGGMEFDARIALIQRGMRSRRELLLQELYTEAFGKPVTSFNETTLSELEGLSENQFNDAVLNVLARREQQCLTRHSNRRKASEEEKISRVTRAFETIRERDRQLANEKVNEARALLDSVIDVSAEVNHQRKISAEFISPGSLMKKVTAWISQNHSLKDRDYRRFLGSIVQQAQREQYRTQVITTAYRQFGDALQEMAPALVGATLVERRDWSGQIRTCLGNIKEALDEIEKGSGQNYANRTLTKWIRQHRRKPEAAMFQEMKDALFDLNLKGDRHFYTTFQALCHFTGDLIENIPAAEWVVASIGRTFSKGSRSPKLDVFDLASSTGAVFLRQLSFLHDAEGAFLATSPSNASLGAYLGKILLNFPEVQHYSPTGNRTSIQEAGEVHWKICENMSRLMQSGETLEIQRLSSAIAKLSSEGFWYMVGELNAGLHRYPGLVDSLNLQDIGHNPALSQLANEIDQSGCFTFQLLNDFFLQKAAQARVIEYFSRTAATQFLLENNPEKFSSYGSIYDSYPIITELATRNHHTFLKLCVDNLD